MIELKQLVKKWGQHKAYRLKKQAKPKWKLLQSAFTESVCFLRSKKKKKNLHEKFYQTKPHLQHTVQPNTQLVESCIKPWQVMKV